MPFLHAQDPKEIKFKSRDLEKVKAELNQKKEERERLEREAEELSRAVRENEGKMKNVETSLFYTKQKNFEIDQKVATTKNQHDKLAATVSDRRAQLKNTAKTYYVASILQTPDAPVSMYTRQVIHGQAYELRRAHGKKEETGENLQELIETQQVIRGEVRKQQDRLSGIRTSTENKERLLTKKKSRQEILETEMKELQQTAEQLASLIDVLRTKAQEEKETEKELRRQKQMTGQSPIRPRSLPWPVQGKVVTRFGRQQHPTLGTTFVSNGIVIASAGPQTMTAVGDGKVLYAGEFMSYGNMVVVEHPGDWYTVYGQLVGWEVEKGAAIKKGDAIGMSRPKASGGTEAYFELRFYGKSTDPLPWLVRQE